MKATKLELELLQTQRQLEFAEVFENIIYVQKYKKEIEIIINKIRINKLKMLEQCQKEN